MIRLLTQKDKPAALDYLGRHEIDTVHLYSNITEFGIDNDKKLRRCGDYFGYFEENSLKGILPFYNLGSCIPHFESEAAIPEMTALMKEREFGYLIGMRRVVKPLYDGIEAVKKTESYDECHYFINRGFKPFVLSDIRFTHVDDASDDTVFDFIVEARVKGFQHKTSNADMRKQVAQRGPDEFFIIAERNGKMAAQGCVNAYTPGTGQIAGVYTAPDERGKGYCKATVSELCGLIIRKGKIPTLSVVKDNTPAVRAYQALGFENHDDYLIIRIGKVT